ncbi:MAG: hypothetical protein AB7I48_02865 [Planctomycetaceae bacterium]
MSTRAGRTSAATPEAPPITAGQGDEQGRTSARRSRNFRTLLIAVAGAVALLWAAPWLVARHVMKHGVEFTGADARTVRVEVRRASLGWLSPVVLSDVTVNDLDGAPLARAGRVASQRQLWRLLTDRSRPGHFDVEGADVTIVVRDDGLNLIDVLRVLSSGQRGKSLSDVAVRASSGRLRIQDAAGMPLLQLEDLELNGLDRGSPERRIELELTAQGVYDGERLPLQFALEWTGPRATDPLRSGTGRAGLKFAPLPLAKFASQWTELPAGWTFDSGLVSGQMAANWDFGGTHKVQAGGTVTIADLRGGLAVAHGPPGKLDRRSEELTFDLDGDYHAETDELLISSVHVKSSPLTAAAVGRIEDLRGQCRVELNGEVQYDLTTILDRLSADGRDQVTVDGLRTGRFAVSGPLVCEVAGAPQFDLSQVAFEADVQWDQAEAFGVRSEEAMLLARFAEGILELEPRHVPVSGGQWRGVPRIDTQRSPAHAELRPGLVLENIEFSQEMCHQWLKYLSPPMAQAASAEGRFSIALSECDLALEQASVSLLQGTLSIHSARIQPGPFSQQIIGVVGVVESLIPGRRSQVAAAVGNDWLTFPEQDVPFQMTDGRMFHSGLEFRVGSVLVRTSGSVGLDESLDLLLEIPVPDDWLRGSFLADTLHGEVLRIPLRGTFQNPHFDRRALSEFAGRFAARAGEGLLRRLLDN